MYVAIFLMMLISTILYSNNCLYLELKINWTRFKAIALTQRMYYLLEKVQLVL